MPALLRVRQTRPKIRVKKKEDRTSWDGIVSDSTSEMRRWELLQTLERVGKIRSLMRQVKFPLIIPNGRHIAIRSERHPNGRRCFYTADFTYYDMMEPGYPDGIYTINEHKGVWTEAARLRLAVFEAIYGFRVVITGEAKLIQRKRAIE